MAANNERYGVALIGCGRIGAVHLRAILGNPRLTLKYVVDVNEEFAKKAALQSTTAKAVTKLDEVLADKDVKGVVICSPTAEHREAILALCKAGKHIMCEKPISLNVKEIDECYAEAKKCGVILLCGYQRRSDPSFVALFDAVKRGDIGTPQIVKTISRDNPVPTLAYLKISGGIFHDCGSHDIDVTRWVMQEDPIEVSAFASCFNPDIKAIDDFDTVLINLKFPSGGIANIDLSRKACYGYDQRIEVLGDKGMVQSQNRQPTTTVISTVTGINADPFCYSFPQRYVEAYGSELEHFTDILAGKTTTPRITHDDARKVAIIADAVEESVRKGHKIVLNYA